MEYAPLASVTVPIEVPLIITIAPGIGSFALLSYTRPETCEKLFLYEGATVL